MAFMTQREEDLQGKVDKLVGMIEDIIFKHPYTAAMFEEELRIRGHWPLKKEKNHGNNERAAEDSELHPTKG